MSRPGSSGYSQSVPAVLWHVVKVGFESCESGLASIEIDGTPETTLTTGRRLARRGHCRADQTSSTNAPKSPLASINRVDE
jgi:hypothetical protein